jgi:hypothetical protein
MLVSLGVTGLAAIAVFLTTASVVILQRHETAEAKRELEEYKLSADGKVADAKKEGIEAGKVAGNAMVRASELEKEAAVIQSAAATANMLAAQANERAAQIQQAAAWRTLGNETTTTVATILARQGGGEIELSWPANDPEAIFLGSQIDEVFRNANSIAGRNIWKLTFQPRVYAHMVPFGIRIIGADPGLVDKLRGSFTGAGIPFSTELVPTTINDSPGLTIGGGPMPAAMIFVGSKHPPN